MMVYTWWCWHICKGEVVGVELDQLGEEIKVFWCAPNYVMVLDWNYVLIHCSLDQICNWYV